MQREMVWKWLRLYPLKSPDYSIKAFSLIEFMELLGKAHPSALIYFYPTVLVRFLLTICGSLLLPHRLLEYSLPCIL